MDFKLLTAGTIASFALFANAAAGQTNTCSASVTLGLAGRTNGSGPCPFGVTEFAVDDGVAEWARAFGAHGSASMFVKVVKTGAPCPQGSRCISTIYGSSDGRVDITLSGDGATTVRMLLNVVARRNTRTFAPPGATAFADVPTLSTTPGGISVPMGTEHLSVGPFQRHLGFSLPYNFSISCGGPSFECVLIIASFLENAGAAQSIAIRFDDPPFTVLEWYDGTDWHPGEPPNFSADSADGTTIVGNRWFGISTDPDPDGDLFPDDDSIFGTTACTSPDDSPCTDNCPGLSNDQTETDGDEIGDACDNCPDAPNGPGGGTCIEGDLGLLGAFCDFDSDCGSGGFCSLDQEDYNTDGLGDACDPDVVPEPSQWAMLIAGAALLVLLYRRRTKGLRLG